MKININNLIKKYENELEHINDKKFEYNDYEQGHKMGRASSIVLFLNDLKQLQSNSKLVRTKFNRTNEKNFR